MATGNCWQIGKSLAEANKYMMESHLGADVEFCVGKESAPEGSQTFLVHKYMLVSRSPVFETMFYGSFEQTPGKAIEIPDVSPRAFKILLGYIYSDQCIIDDIEVALSLVYASKKYMLTNLTEAALKYISEHTTAENVCLVLEKCSKLDEVATVNKCLEFLQIHAACVVRKESFVNSLSKASLKFLLESDNMCVLEVDLLGSVLRWGKKKVKKETGQTWSPVLVLEKIKELVPLIRFPLIPYKSLQAYNAKYRILSSDDMLHLFEVMNGKTRPELSQFIYRLRGHSSATRFSIAEDFQLSSLVKREEKVRRKFTLKFKPLKPNMTVFAVTIMSGPYLIRLTIHEPDGQLVSYTEKDMRDWSESDCCRETCVVLQEPVVCQSNLDEPYEMEVFISHSNCMYWYDNVILGKYTENTDLKLKYSNPEIISQVHFIYTN